ncbi:uncharacterized protein PAC_08643 [Phialocephala subalpina]|uniref:Heterokaryon incompatibility domain-containing protein n=1 Tax=Phialocephala subalpina TaxID=576137 RepID=A0A1L7X153_9HELO|nr:uncharacterized protein PAC_08643 [Phialocephala subalpina]
MAARGCHACQTLDVKAILYSDSVVYHHASWAELLTCVETTACELCATIKSGLGAIENEVGKHGGTFCLAVPLNRMQAEFCQGYCGVDFIVNTSITRRSTTVEFFVAQESPLALDGVITGRPVASVASDESCFELVKKWRDTCFTKHKGYCTGPTEVYLPSRVIDVGPTGSSEEPHLKEVNGEKGSYIALSHCWGKATHFVIDRQNLAERKRKIPMKEMPKTFSDAVIVVRKLGYRYLWIDSLCIVQGDHEDWAREAKKMGDYYKHATITISADSASDDQQGFLHGVRDNEGGSFWNLGYGEQIHFRAPKDLPMFRDRDTYLSRRAWTLQEFILSPRSVLYTAGQLVWECHRRKYCESNINSQLESTSGYRKATKRLFLAGNAALEEHGEQEVHFSPRSRWYNLVDDYFLRDMTMSSDGLTAISGIAREIERMSPSQYLAGIWLDEVQKGLLWRVDGDGKILDSYRAPSWSWAALGCTAEGQQSRLHIYERMRTLHHQSPNIPESKYVQYEAQLLGYNIEQIDDDPFGRVSSASITIRGKLLKAPSWGAAFPPCFSSFPHDVEARGIGTDHLYCSFDVNEGDPQTRLQSTFLFQVTTFKIIGTSLKNCHALLLVLVGNRTPETYRRVGIAEIQFDGALADYGWETKDVCII